MHSSCPPPKRFVAAVDVDYAKFLPGQPPFIRRKRSRGRFAVGIRYELKAQKYLEGLLLGVPNSEFHSGLWIEFQDKNGKRWCQVDALGLVHGSKTGIIYEIKYQHTSDAWWQLKWLYWPVLQAALPGYHFGLVEICHWHDPSTIFPERYDLTPTPLSSKHGRIAVHIFNPRRVSRLQRAGQGSGKDSGATQGSPRGDEGAARSPDSSGPRLDGLVGAGCETVPD